MDLQDYGTEARIFTAQDQQTLGYRQGVCNADQSGDFGLFIFFHGAGERGSDNKVQMAYIAEPVIQYLTEEKIKCVVLFPQCPPQEQWVDTPWAATEHVMPEEPSLPMRHVMELLDSKIAEFQVDPKRIYVCGLSMGGYGTWDLLCRRPDFFAGAIAVCGGVDCVQVKKLAKLPLIIYHGELDPAVPVCRSRNAAAALKEAGSTSFQYVEVAGAGHNVWVTCFQNRKNIEWLFAQRKKS